MPARSFPSVPHFSAPITDQNGLGRREWLALFAEIVRRLPVVGSATFVAGTSVAVTLPAPEPDATYHAAIEPVANRTYWITSKTTAGFTINASASNSDTVGWILTRT